MMTPVTAMLLINAIDYCGWKFKVVGDFKTATYLQATFLAPDSSDAHNVVVQKSRKWLLSKHMTDGELVQTAFLCVKTAVEHEMRELFRFEGKAIYGPHFSAFALADLCGDARSLDKRGAAPATEVEVWVRDEESTYMALLLVSDTQVTEAQIASWTDAQCQEAETWALAVHYSASDNDVEVPPRPAFLDCEVVHA